MKQELQNYHNKAEKLIRSFGRIKSRKLSDHKKNLLENFLPLYQIKNTTTSLSTPPLSSSPSPSLPLPLSLPPRHLEHSERSHESYPQEISHCVRDDERGIQNLQNSQKNILEIGFGFGDFLFAKAKNNPQINFFGSEPHINGVVNLLSKLEQEPLVNLKISTTDIRILLQSFPDNFFDEIYILFPDPWPKSKHFKRRLINIEFLDKIISPKMKKAAKLTIATDHDSYKTWILAEILRSQKFLWQANSKKDWQNFPNDWIMTKYQKKALDEGRVSVIFNLEHA